MSCVKPLTGLRYIDNVTGEVKTKVFPRSFNNEHTLFDPKTYTNQLETFPIPCGQCIGCRLDYSRRWADRLMAEATLHEKNCFLTLTYDDDHLPPKRDGSPYHSLVKSHMSEFMKNLRKRRGAGLRFFGVGEYGEINNRPHFHIILFGDDFSDDRKYNFTKNGFQHWVSPTLYDPENIRHGAWKYGLVDIANVSWQSCAYVARYCVKKLKGDGAAQYKELNYEPEFALMSRNPGIAKDYFEEHFEQYRTGLFIGTEQGSLKLGNNPYFDNLYLGIDPFDAVEWKNERKEIAKDITRQKLENTDKSYLDLQAVVENRKIKQCDKLVRTLI